MTLELEVQRPWTGEAPDDAALRRWAEAVPLPDPASLVIRIVDAAESRALDRAYRGKDRPTNVLSFPFEAPPPVQDPHLGDLVICAPVVAAEAEAQGKAPEAHWAHMVIHGLLHLLGRDHQTAEDAAAMEAEERRLLAGLGYPDPYGDEN